MDGMEKGWLATAVAKLYQRRKVKFRVTGQDIYFIHNIMI